MPSPHEPIPLITPQPAPDAPEMRGLHAGAIVLAGVVVANGGNYAFHLIATRLLGPPAYGTVVSLLTLSGLLSLPVAGIQLAIARSVARLNARGELQLVRGLFGRSMIAAVSASTAVALLLVALTPLIQDWLKIPSVSAIVLMAVATIPAIVTPFAWGVAQGLQRFTLLAVSMAAGAVARVVFLLAFGLAGSGSTGALAATAIGGSVSLGWVAWPLRHHLALSPHPPFRVRTLACAVAPFVTGLLAITSLSTADVIVAKAFLGSHDAGVYGGASLIGRVVLYVPAAIATVLLPKISSRVHMNRATDSVFAASLAATAGFCLLITLVYATVPRLILIPLLGRAFSGGASLLWMFGVAMTGYAVLNVLLVYHLGHGSSRFSVVLLAGSAAQLAAYGALHSSAREILWVSIGTAMTLLAAHEFFFTRASGARAMIAVLRDRPVAERTTAV